MDQAQGYAYSDFVGAVSNESVTAVLCMHLGRNLLLSPQYCPTADFADLEDVHKDLPERIHRFTPSQHLVFNYPPSANSLLSKHA